MVLSCLTETRLVKDMAESALLNKGDAIITTKKDGTAKAAKNAKGRLDQFLRDARS
jgi:hypothetical protein